MGQQIVICIPTLLQNRQAIASALVDKYGTDYLFMGRLFRATVCNQSCLIDIGDREPNLAAAFEVAGQNKISAAAFEKIDHHQQIIYLTATDTGYAACLKMARLTKILLKISGIAVKVESAGIAHTAATWLANCDSQDVFDIYSLYVLLVEGDDSYYSCGMHNFGKADVAISLTEDVAMAIYVMNVFNYYRLTESPILQDGHTFQSDIESPTYKIKWMPDPEHEVNSNLYNSYGRWYLSIISNDRVGKEDILVSH